MTNAAASNTDIALRAGFMLGITAMATAVAFFEIGGTGAFYTSVKDVAWAMLEAAGGGFAVSAISVCSMREMDKRLLLAPFVAGMATMLAAGLGHLSPLEAVSVFTGSVLGTTAVQVGGNRCIRQYGRIMQERGVRSRIINMPSLTQPLLQAEQVQLEQVAVGNHAMPVRRTRAASDITRLAQPAPEEAALENRPQPQRRSSWSHFVVNNQDTAIFTGR